MQAEATIKPRPKIKHKATSKPKPAIQPEPTTPSERQERLWTRKEYYKMAELGLFKKQRVELIEGRILIMAAMNSYHRTAVTLADDAVRKIFKVGFFVMVQCPLGIGESSDPEPDVAVVAGNVRDYEDKHPSTAALVIEIADSSLSFDQKEKASLYAKASVPDYWIVNLKDKRLEVRRRPKKDDTQPFGYGYAELTLYTGKDAVSPLAKPKTKIKVANLLPRKVG